MRRIAIFIILLTTIISQANAQTPSPLGGGTTKTSFANEASPKSLTIKGKVVESTNHTPMEFASVALYSATDSTIAGGVITVANGSFEIKKLKAGKYFLRANFIGFEKTTVTNIVVNPTNPIKDLGQIELIAAVQQVGEVAVTADRARVEFKIDRRVVNVSQDLTATGGSAVEVLENTPSVQTDFDGNITLRGSSSFTVLIDGKPSVLQGSDALRQIPATNIENIEIITNPSAKYDPDGSSGIINVVMKKNLKDSFSGLVNMTAGLNDRYRGDLNLNYRTGKWNLLLGADFTDMPHKGTRDTKQEIYTADTITYRNSIGSGDQVHKGHSVKGGFDYTINDKTSFGMTGSVGYHGNGNINIGTQHEYSNMGTPDIYTYQDESESRSGNYWSTDMNFQHKFDKKGHEIQALFYVSGSNGDSKTYQTRFLTDANWIALDNNSVYNMSMETSDEKEYRAKVDYTLPLGEKDKFEAGYQARIDKESENFDFDESYDNINWVKNNQYSSSFNYASNIHSLYSTFAHAGDGFSYQLGVRGEYSDRKIESIKSPLAHKLNKVDFFPTLHFSQKLKNDFELQASYSKRINRPDANNLEPFTSFMDQYNVRVGNPDLKPEYTDSYDLTILKRLNKSFVSVEGYYRNTNDLMTRIQTLGADGIMVNTMANVNDDYSLGAELMANIEVKPGFRIVGSATLYNYWLKGSLNGASVDQNSTNFDSRLNLDMKLAKNTRLQLTGIYRGATASAQGTRDAMIFANAAIKQDFFKNKLTATLQMQDIFASMKFAGTTYGEGFRTIFKYQREPRVVQLTLSYKMNNFKVKQPRGEDPATNNENGNGGEF
jgi:outer membrane receptor protein involved in Fe transport